MRRLPWWASALSIGLLVMGCNTQNVEPPQPKEKASKELPSGHPSVSKMPSGHPPLGEKGPTISGTISVAPELADKVSPEAVLYIVARREGVRAPIAVVRLKGVSFPTTYTLSRQHMMGPPGPSEGKLEIVARLDKDGFVGPPQPGDIEGTFPNNPVSIGDKNINFTLDKLIE